MSGKVLFDICLPIYVLPKKNLHPWNRFIYRVQILYANIFLPYSDFETSLFENGGLFSNLKKWFIDINFSPFGPIESKNW